MDLWPAAMYAKETIAIKDLVMELDIVPTTGKCELARAAGGPSKARNGPAGGAHVALPCGWWCC